MTEIRAVRVRMLPNAILKEAVAAGPLWRALGHLILEQAIQDCPVGTNQDLGADFGQEHGGEHLRDSMEVRFVLGADPRILIGSTQTTGEGEVSKLGLILEGTEPHPIDPVNASVLRFTSHGQVVFAPHVDHPGTHANPFVQKAMQRVVRSLGGVAVRV